MQPWRILCIPVPVTQWVPERRAGQDRGDGGCGSPLSTSLFSARGEFEVSVPGDVSKGGGGWLTSPWNRKHTGRHPEVPLGKGVSELTGTRVTLKRKCNDEENV